MGRNYILVQRDRTKELENGIRRKHSKMGAKKLYSKLEEDIQSMEEITHLNY